MVAAAVGLAQQRCQHCCCPPPSRSAALISPARVLPQQATLHSISSSSGSSSSSHRAQRPLLWHPKRRHATVIAAASPQPQPQEEQPQQPQQQQEDPPQLDDEDPEQQMARLPRPSQHHQPQLGGKQRAALRSQAEGLAKAKTLQRVQVGAKGVTFNVLVTIMDALTKHEFVRVKLGEGSGLERKQTAEQLAQLLDAAVVGQVGFTITLYRQKGLPRPDSLLPKPSVQA